VRLIQKELEVELAQAAAQRAREAEEAEKVRILKSPLHSDFYIVNILGRTLNSENFYRLQALRGSAKQSRRTQGLPRKKRNDRMP